MNEMIDRVTKAMEWAWGPAADNDPPPLEHLARAAILAMRDSLKTEDFTLSEAQAIRRFFDKALDL